MISNPAERLTEDRPPPLGVPTDSFVYPVRRSDGFEIRR
jgi:hypothetical protein